MSRSTKNKNLSDKKRYGLKQRKMKPYCLTGDKKIDPEWSSSNISYENYDNIGDAKKAREDRKIMKKTEVHSTRQQAKKKLRKDLDDLD